MVLAALFRCGGPFDRNKITLHAHILQSICSKEVNP